MGVNAKSLDEGSAVGLCLIRWIEVEVVELYTLGVDAGWDAECVGDADISVVLDVPLSAVARELSAADEGKGISVDTNGVIVPKYPSAGSIDDAGISVELDDPLSTVARELIPVDEAKVASGDNNGATVPKYPSAESTDDPGTSVEAYEACGTVV
ncbi:hypothetical protein ACP6JE_001427 [Aspergillus fumigatus]